MGEVIRKDAAANDIIADGRTTLTKATARGGDWASTAELRLGQAMALCTSIEARIASATVAAAPAMAALDAGNDRADDLIGRISDDVWNAVGRPGNDVAFDIIFPGGFGYYAEGDVSEQPDRMDLLAELLGSGIHPSLPGDRATALAAEVTTMSATLRGLVDAARPLRARVELAEKMRTAVARATQVALANLKRSWKADGKSEADIHSVIPDRPKAKKPKPSGPAGPPEPGPTS